MTLRKLRSLKSKHIGDKSWRAFLEYLTGDVPMLPTLHEQVAEGTARTLLPIWMKNCADNLDYIRFGDNVKREIPVDYHQQTFADVMENTPVLESEPDFPTIESPIEEVNGVKVKFGSKGSAVVVGRGPSLFENKHCEVLAKAVADGTYKGKIVASDGGLVPCLEAGLIPDFVVTVDGAPVIKKFFDHPLVQQHGSKIKWITTVTVHHSVYLAARAAGMQVYWFQPIFDDWRQNESWTRLQVLLSRTEKFDRGVPRAQAGGNAGAFAWITAMSILKRSPVALIGIDLGYPEETPLEKTQYYSSVFRIANGDVSLIKRSYKHFYHPVFKKKAYADHVFYHYREAFIEMQLEVPAWYRLYGGTINCTEGGTLFSPEIKSMMFKEFLEKWQK